MANLLEHLRAVPVAEDGDAVDGLADLLELVLRESNVARREVGLEITDLRGARNGDDVVPLRRDPGDAKLGRRDALLLGNLGELLDQLSFHLEHMARTKRGNAHLIILAEVFFAEPRVGGQAAVALHVIAALPSA